MINSKTISVVMPTYNGEKYLREQLDSILNQTLLPDEIIISDDGSKDGTLKIAEEWKTEAEKAGMSVSILTDNPQHGWIKNYEWASRHATGDYIFNCDQDDIWLPEKVERVIKVFEDHPDALLVGHEITLINGAGEFLCKGTMAQRLSLSDFPEDATVCLERQANLPTTTSSTLINAMATCLSKELLSWAIPFPGFAPVDQWEPFLALCKGGFYFLNSPLTKYRKHNANVSTRDPNRSVWKKLKQCLHLLRTEHFSVAPYYQGKAMQKVLEEQGLQDSPAYPEVLGVIRIGELKMKIANSGRIKGTIAFCRAYRHDMRLHNSYPYFPIFQVAALLRGRILK